jgi:hypothetical protein
MPLDKSALESLPPEHLALLRAEGQRILDESKIEDYAPYAKQRQFHNAGKLYRERLFMAGNQLGKRSTTELPGHRLPP